MNPKLSFVIPAHNADPWLSECLKSCLDQTFNRFEVVVVNDGSTDGTKDILDHYAKSFRRIRPIHLAQNVGRSEARNIGNKAANASIIMVLDADDKAVRNRAKITWDIFHRFNPDFLYGGFITINPLGGMVQSYKCHDFNPETSRSHKTHYIVHSTVAYRKGVTLNVQYESGDVSRLGIDDWKFIWDVHNRGYKFMNVKKPLAYYRVLDSSISRTRDEKEVAELKEKILANL